MYNNAFFADLAEGSAQSAREVVPFILSLIQPASIADIGCGTGAWLRSFEAHGVNDFIGYDGNYIDRSTLEIAADRFRVADLSMPLLADRRFDLAVCLEVGEHLPMTAASVLVKSLCGLSDIVLFSAAIPFQGGTHHLNEQWPGYWAEIFRERGYVCIDCLRDLFWENTRVMWWYAQNMMLYVRNESLGNHPTLEAYSKTSHKIPHSLVHPNAYVSKCESLSAICDLRSPPGLRWATRALGKSLGPAINRRIDRWLRPSSDFLLSQRSR